MKRPCKMSRIFSCLLYLCIFCLSVTLTVVQGTVLNRFQSTAHPLESTAISLNLNATSTNVSKIKNIESSFAKCGLKSPHQQCQKICQRLTKYCDNTPQSSSSVRTISTSKEEIQMHLQCVSNCFHLNHSNVMSKSTTSPFDDLFNQSSSSKPSIEYVTVLPPSGFQFDSNLTSAELCRREGLEGSIACEFQYDHPEEALKAFKDYGSFLSKIEYSPVSSSYNQDLYSESDEDTNLETYNKSTNSTENETSTKKQRSLRYIYRENSESLRNRRSTDITLEACSTSLSLLSPSSAIHVKSGKVVNLFHFRTEFLNAQTFQVGSCRNGKYPLISVKLQGKKSVCMTEQAQHSALLLIDTNNDNINQFETCRQYLKHFYVCRDWIYLQGHCQLFMLL